MRAIDIANELAGRPSKTLRDEFAMAALTGFLSNPEGYRQSMLCAGLPNDESMAHDAYKIADAMMEARDAKR